MIFSQDMIIDLEKRYRANLINTLGGFKSVVLIGTRSLQGNDNLAIFNSLFHIGADPALCGIIIRPNEINQNTLGNIINTKQFTVNHILSDFYKQAHQCSAKYEEGLSEFKMVNLTPEFMDGIVAPFVLESKIKFACEMVQQTAIEINGTTLIIGKITKIIIPDELIQTDGFIDIEAGGTITCSGLDSYHTTQKIGRLQYAKADRGVKEI